MAARSAVRQLCVAVFAAALVAAGAPPAGLGASGLPPCDGVPQVAGTACRALPTRVFAGRELPRPRPGYHHLGATSSGEWSGVLGRITVRDTGVRPGTHDFVATRFMAKRQRDGRVWWLEAGWAETGWSGDGRQRIYTFDTNRNAWTFYDQYALRDGDQVWIYLHTDVVDGRSVWQAWLWWGDRWNLLAAEELPLGDRTQVEQYVEVFVDPDKGGPGFAVPPVALDNVQLKAGPQGALRYWRDDVPTGAGANRGRYCLNWQTRFDTWTAGDC